MNTRIKQDYKKYYNIIGDPIGTGDYPYVYKGKEKLKLN